MAQVISKYARSLSAALATMFVVALAIAPTAEARIGNLNTLERAYLRWQGGVEARGEERLLVVPIGFSRGLSPIYSRAGGVVQIDLESRRLSVEITGLPAGLDYDLWLVDNRSGLDSSVAAQPRDGRVLVSQLERRPDGSVRLTAALPRVEPGFEIDRIVIARHGVALERGGILFGAPSLFQRLYFHDEGVSPTVAAASGWRPDKSSSELFAELLDEGERLFVEETFDGNGRTCASCHPPQNNFTIDPEFIATLAPDDALFVNETNPELAQLENSVLMRDYGLILANVDGLDDPTNKFVMRGVPHILGIANSLFNGNDQAPLQNTGWSGDGAPGAGTLRDFAVGAVRQHAPRTLDRIEGTDFRLPTESELDALEAFQLALGRPEDLELQTMRLIDPDAEEGRVLFITTDSENGTKAASKCVLCHGEAGALSLPTGRNQNFPVGVENHPHPADETGEPRPYDGGFGTEFDPETGGFGNNRFATPPIVESADTAPFFHNNVSEDLEDAIFFYQSDAFQRSPAGAALLEHDSGGAPLVIETFKLSAFLTVVNTLENIRSANAFQESAKLEPILEDAAAILDLALVDVNDGIDVLTTLGLHGDVVANLGTAKTGLESARMTPDQATRNGMIDTALVKLRSAQPLMVVPRLLITSHEDLEIVTGIETLTAEVLDVDVRGIRFQIDGQVLCADRDRPYECDWDTTGVPNNVYRLTVTTVDYAGGVTQTGIDLEVGNIAARPTGGNP